MKKVSLITFLRTAVVCAFLMLILAPAIHILAQNKKDLQKQRDDINDKIELTKKLIKESEKQQKSTTAQLQMLSEQIAYREELLNSIEGDIKNIDGEIGTKEQDVQSLTNQLMDMKKEYGKMIYNGYRNRSSYSRMMYLFASDDFNQAYKRFKMIQRYAMVRKKQADQITSTQIEIKNNIERLEGDRRQKEELANKKVKEKDQIAENKTEQQKKLTSLKGEEQKLRDQQKKQKADRDKLTAKIQEAIAQELEAERKKAEEARKKAAAAANATAGTSTGTTAKTGGSAAKPVPAAAPKALELAPEVKLANTNFESNKGDLPWPVSAGLITSRFGRQPHPSLSGIEVNNNGIDFTTEKDASVLAIYAGTVTSVFNIPGAGQNIIVTHGTYKTVYSGLASVSVKVGDKVSLKQKLGSVLYDGEEYTLHFEIWKVNSEAGTAQNPEGWIKRK
jgi:murein hydrolase activator